MAPSGVEFVAVFTWTLLLVLVQGWVEIKPGDVQGFFEQYSTEIVKPDIQKGYSITFPDADAGSDEDYDNEEDDDDEEPLSIKGDGKGALDPKSKLHEPHTNAKPRADNKDPTGFDFRCTKKGFKISLVKEELDKVLVLGLKDLVRASNASEECGYDVDLEQGTLRVPFTGCHVKNETDDFVLQLLLSGGTRVRTATCPHAKSVKSGESLQPRGHSTLVCPFSTSPPALEVNLELQLPHSHHQHPVPQLPHTHHQHPVPQLPHTHHQHPVPQLPHTHHQHPVPQLPHTHHQHPVPQLPHHQHPVPQLPHHQHPLPHPPHHHPLPHPPPDVPPPHVPHPQHPSAPYCDFASVERVPCGTPWMTPQSCQSMGCCWDSACFYPMDECTSDNHFVFAIHHNTASLNLDPASLVIPGTSCKPVILTATVAVFKFKVNECGTREFMVGATKVYLAEVQVVVNSLNLKYGVISRSPQLRFLIECRYSTGKSSLASTGFMVKTSSYLTHANVYADGLYGVELRLATDNTFASFHQSHHQPLRLLLGKKVYFQLHLISPVPKSTLLVNYCVAYPRSAHNALVLVYEGCANPFDPQSSVIKNIAYNGPTHERRFEVDVFQFMEQNTNKYLDEEIYFMCSTEVCFPSEKECKEHCFDW
ncbi:unnamed protein product [Knipowitschia caucasica]